MPSKLTPCATPGCPVLTDGRHCPTHTASHRRTQAAGRRRAGDPSMTVYSTAAWRHTRERQLHDHPDCAHCGAPGGHVDHRTPRQILVALGIHTPDDPQWLQTLCASCHNRKTATIDAPLLARLKAGEPPEHLVDT